MGQESDARKLYGDKGSLGMQRRVSLPSLPLLLASVGIFIVMWVIAKTRKRYLFLSTFASCSTTAIQQKKKKKKRRCKSDANGSPEITNPTAIGPSFKAVSRRTLNQWAIYQSHSTRLAAHDAQPPEKKRPGT